MNEKDKDEISADLNRMLMEMYDWGIADAKIAAIKAIEAAVLAEREACAKACEPVEGYAYEVGVYKTMQTLAAAIRVRSEQ